MYFTVLIHTIILYISLSPPLPVSSSPCLYSISRPVSPPCLSSISLLSVSLLSLPLLHLSPLLPLSSMSLLLSLSLLHLSPLLQTRQLVTVCDSKLLSSAILALSAARPECIAQRGTPSPSSLTPSPSRSPCRSSTSPCRSSTSPSRQSTSPSRHTISPRHSVYVEGERGRGKRSSLQADWHEENWVR